MNYAYIRVRTNMQTVQNQKIAIRNYARTHLTCRSPDFSKDFATLLPQKTEKRSETK